MDQRPQVSFDELLANRALFNEYVYTPLLDAVSELKKRLADPELEQKTKEYLDENIRPIFQDGLNAVLFRTLVTPNYELRRFMCVPDTFGLRTILLEIHEDKFSLNNSLKYRLAKLAIHFGLGKKGGHKIHYKTILNFNESHKKKISQVQTLWSQSLIDFHHELFAHVFPNNKESLIDISHWLHKEGNKAPQYYFEVIALFIRHGILFENFSIESEEREFIRDVFLPAFTRVWDVMGIKPLIVALEPTEIEEDLFWLSYPPDVLPLVEEKEKLITF
jgi:hypothetical protein